MKTNERTFKMKENFMTLHNEGRTIPEIAKIYNLSTATIYKSLEEIAQKNGVSRKSLLAIPHVEHVCYERQLQPVEPVDLTGFKESFESTMNGFEAVRSAIKAEIKKQEKINDSMVKEEEKWQK